MTRKKAVHLSFSDAAEKVLVDFGKKQPMHYKEITDKALKLGWLNTEGKTPAATLYAQIFSEIKRQKMRGEQPRFVQHGNGLFGLSRWQDQGLAFEITQHNHRMRQKLHKKLLEMDPGQFEELVGQWLADLGFEDIQVTKQTGDGGIDVRGTLVIGGVIRTRMAVQVKRWKPKNNIQSPVVQQVRGSLSTHEHGLIITTSDFSAGAKKEACKENAIPISLMNGEQFVALLASSDLCTKSKDYNIIESIE